MDKDLSKKLNFFREKNNIAEVIKILLDKYSPSDTATIVSKLTSINKKIIYKHILSIRQKG